jgi:hypothetical protein
MVKPLMMHCRASHTVPMLCIAENPSRKLHPLKGKTAHRGLPRLCNNASAAPRSQVLNASGKNSRRATTARQSPLLPQTTKPKPNTSCSSLSSFACQVCVNTYLNNTYGNFGGFVASTFNAQQAIPGISGNPALDTLATDGELGALKQGVPWALRTAGDAIAMGSKTPGTFWAGGLTETVGVLASDTLFAVGAMTTPFASVALHNARSNCGG